MFKDTKVFYIFFLAVSIFLALYPFADIAFSKLFYHGNAQFLIKHYLTGDEYFYEYLIRRLLLPLIVVLLLFFPIVVCFFPYLKNKFKVFYFNKVDILYVWISAFLMSIVVNNILKDNWGRARPNDITVFDGDKEFTSWVQHSSACSDNCSFVSGDASVGFFIASFYYITNNKKFLYASIVCGLFFGLFRIGAGAHYLSDILMSFVVINLGLKIIHFFYYNSIKWIKK